MKNSTIRLTCSVLAVVGICSFLLLSYSKKTFVEASDAILTSEELDSYPELVQPLVGPNVKKESSVIDKAMKQKQLIIDKKKEKEKEQKEKYDEENKEEKE